MVGWREPSKRPRACTEKNLTKQEPLQQKLNGRRQPNCSSWSKKQLQPETYDRINYIETSSTQVGLKQLEEEEEEVSRKKDHQSVKGKKEPEENCRGQGETTEGRGHHWRERIAKAKKAAEAYEKTKLQIKAAEKEKLRPAMERGRRRERIAKAKATEAYEKAYW